MSAPLIFLMISNHYPTASSANKHSLWHLAGYLLAGWVGSKIVRDGFPWSRSRNSTK